LGSVVPGGSRAKYTAVSAPENTQNSSVSIRECVSTSYIGMTRVANYKMSYLIAAAQDAPRP